jgi:multisubunit Na+/H+ antiporter MnhB subunit
MNVRQSVLAETGSRTIVPTIFIVSLFLLVVGHDAPGGGFVGGLLAGAALLVVFLSGGRKNVTALLPVQPRSLVGLGMAVSITVASLGLVFGSSFLDAGKITLDLWLVGEISTGSSLLFDVGVYLVVVGLVATVLVELGGPEEAES